MVFLSGPRQCGKTTLAQSLFEELKVTSPEERYLNWDNTKDRERILREEFPSDKGLFILDEIHKYTRWRQLLKGLYDKRKATLQILVTGSAKLDFYRRGGDSLQGRYHHLRLHPLSVNEINSQNAVKELFTFGGFPEPFLLKSEDESRRWSREYRTRLIREELLDLERVKEVSLLEKLTLRLPELVGSLLSINALREDLQIAHQTAARWIELLERMYHIFRIYPFGAPRIRAVKKEAKHYHFDWNVVASTGARFENLIACHLLKECHYLEDTKGLDRELKYFRDTDGREVDFVIVEGRKPLYFIEAKARERDVSPSLRYLKAKFPNVPAVQVLLEFDDDLVNRDGIRICNAQRFLKELAV